LGIGDWGLGPIPKTPNPKPPKPNPKIKKKKNNILFIKNINYIFLL